MGVFVIVCGSLAGLIQKCVRKYLMHAGHFDRQISRALLDTMDSNRRVWLELLREKEKHIGLIFILQALLLTNSRLGSCRWQLDKPTDDGSTRVRQFSQTLVQC